MAGTWKLKKSSSGESRKKTVGGRVYHWCGKCGNWTATHSEAEHGKGRSTKRSSSKKGDKKKSNFSPETNLTSFEPQAWVAAFYQDEPQSLTMLDVLKYTYFILTFAIILGLPVPAVNTFLAIYTDTNALITTLITYLTSIYDSISQVLKFLQSLSGPLLWILLGFLACK